MKPILILIVLLFIVFPTASAKDYPPVELYIEDHFIGKRRIEYGMKAFPPLPTYYERFVVAFSGEADPELANEPVEGWITDYSVTPPKKTYYKNF